MKKLEILEKEYRDYPCPCRRNNIYREIYKEITSEKQKQEEKYFLLVDEEKDLSLEIRKKE